MSKVAELALMLCQEAASTLQQRVEALRQTLPNHDAWDYLRDEHDTDADIATLDILGGEVIEILNDISSHIDEYEDALANRMADAGVAGPF